MKSLQKQILINAEREALGYYLAYPEKKLSGIYGSLLGQAIGNSLEFMEHREYMPGDDLRYIDWNVYARTDKIALKLYREEVNPAVDILIDSSASMALEGTKKDSALLLLSGFLAAAALNSGYTVKVWASADESSLISQGSGTPITWHDINFKGVFSPVKSFTGSHVKFRYRSIRFFLSDLMWQDDPGVFLSRFASDAALTVVCQIISKQDIRPQLPYGTIRIIDSETNAEQEIMYDYSTQSVYTETIERHRENWHSACKEHNVMFFSFISEEFEIRKMTIDFVRYGLLRVKL